LVKVEGTLDELRALFVQGAKTQARKQSSRTSGSNVVKKTVKQKRAPTAYQKHMKREIARLKKAHPRMKHQAIFKKASKSWKGGKKK
jgi:hypothetical protein